MYNEDHVKDRLLILWIVSGLLAALAGNGAHVGEAIAHASASGHTHAGHDHGHADAHDHGALRDCTTDCLSWCGSSDHGNDHCCVASRCARALAGDPSRTRNAETQPASSDPAPDRFVLRPAPFVGPSQTYRDSRPPPALRAIRTVVLRT